jgi:hypothetical protein
MPGHVTTTRLLILAACALWISPAAAAEREEIESAIVFGRCAEAAGLAALLTVTAPDDPVSWRLLGDAERCRGASRAAVRAYLQVIERGGTDPTVQTLIASLREQLGKVRITVETERPAPLRVEVQVEGEAAPGPAVLQPDGTWLAQDLEPGASATIVVRGTGVDEARVAAAPVGAGGETAVTVRPAWRGIGLVQLLSPPPEGVRVEVPTLDGWQAVAGEQGVRVTAGVVPVAVEGPHGRIETIIEVPADGRTRFDPSSWEPTSLTVSGAPAGAALQLFLEGVEPPMERTVALPATGNVDPEWGIRLAEPTELTGLVGGVGSLVMQHPELGLAVSELVLETGSPNGLELDWRQLEGSAVVRSRYLAWQEARGTILEETRAGLAIGLATVGGGLVLSAIAWAAAGGSSGRVVKARDSALAGMPHPDGAAGWYSEHQAAAADEQAWIGVATASAGVGVAGLGIAGVFGARGQLRLQELGDWTPP